MTGGKGSRRGGQHIGEGSSPATELPVGKTENVPESVGLKTNNVKSESGGGLDMKLEGSVVRAHDPSVDHDNAKPRRDSKADVSQGKSPSQLASSDADALAKAKSDALAALGILTNVADVSTSAATKRRHSKSGDLPNASSGEGATSKSVPISQSRGDGDEDQVEYVPAEVEIPEEFGELADVVARFTASGQKNTDDAETDEQTQKENGAEGAAEDKPEHRRPEDLTTGGVNDDGDRSDGDGTGGIAGHGRDGEEGLSERQRRRQNRLSVAQLKALVREPGVVEQWDVTAEDSLLLVHLKALHGSVPVPVNWRQKRKYLQSKRGMEKTLFKMPQFIEDTGVGAARAAAMEADAAKTAKQKGRERIRPKSGKGVDVDYSVMRDAFFKFQTKPRLTTHGDLYYELREREVNHDGFRPGFLSATLREALGTGVNDPPPWLVAMQRYGPPPSYPGLQIPGLNAPIPVGASFGFHPGGWGKPPVDEYGRPLYGDVFGEGTKYGDESSRFDLPAAEKEKLWGDLRKPGVFEADEDEEAVAGALRRRHNYHDGNDVEGDGEGRDEDDGKVGRGEEKTPAGDAPEASAAGAVGLPGVMSVPTGLKTPADGIELRKGIAPGQLYTVIEQKGTSVGTNAIMGSSHVYDVAGLPGRGGVEGDAEPEGDVAGDKLLKKRKDTGDERESGRDAKKPKDNKAAATAKAKEFKF